MSEKYICIHGHFYQPPRENPWLEEVEFQESAHPYHDWNTRVTAECYAPNSVSRIMDPQGRIVGLVNNYSKISFNFGPTLLYWMNKYNPDLYQSILEADKESIKTFSGHGSAIAQVYNHMIMPLANKRDKETQVKWGIKEFQSRFHRFPEGMWLPETAADNQTLETLAENGVKFTILAPHQAKRVRKIGEEKWEDVSSGKIDPKRAYLCKLASGKSLSLFFYDGKLAADASFGEALSNGELYAKKLMSGFGEAKDGAAIVSLATDGELYGHHRVHGDMTLAYCLYYITKNNLAKITNYAEFLEKSPPQFEVEIGENTSWSCSHGIERWRSDCGDNTGKKPGWKQAWRKPLREAMDWLRDKLAPKFEQDAQQYLKDPWAARNEYVSVVLDRSRGNVDKFLGEQAKRSLSEYEKDRVVKLLEMQRQAMLMYTSCGWFFDEISGIETVQVLMYAARAIQLAEELFGEDLEEAYVKMLEQAPSNVPEFGNGAKVYDFFVRPAMMNLAKIAAQNIIMSLFSAEPNSSAAPSKACCFEVTSELEKHESGKFRLGLGKVKVNALVTLSGGEFGCAAIWLGDHNFTCGASKDLTTEEFAVTKKEILESFTKGQINETIQLIPKHFGKHTYSLKDMTKDDQRRILDFVVEGGIKKARDLYEIIYRDNSALLQFMKQIRIPMPKQFWTAAEIFLNMEIARLLSAQDLDLESLQKTISEAQNLAVEIDSELLALEATERVSEEFSQLSASPENTQIIDKIAKLIQAVNTLPVKLNLWHSQNIAFKIAENHYQAMKEKTSPEAKAWVGAFGQLCELIGVRLE